MKLPSLLATLMASVGSARAKVVEVDLTAKKAEIAFGNGGVMQTMYTYNGSVPGPSIEGQLHYVFVQVLVSIKLRLQTQMLIPSAVYCAPLS